MQYTGTLILHKWNCVCVCVFSGSANPDHLATDCYSYWSSSQTTCEEFGLLHHHRIGRQQGRAPYYHTHLTSKTIKHHKTKTHLKESSTECSRFWCNAMWFSAKSFNNGVKLIYTSVKMHVHSFKELDENIKYEPNGQMPACCSTMCRVCGVSGCWLSFEDTRVLVYIRLKPHLVPPAQRPCCCPDDTKHMGGADRPEGVAGRRGLGRRVEKGESLSQTGGTGTWLTHTHSKMSLITSACLLSRMQSNQQND